jgi:hypothetical protein
LCGLVCKLTYELHGLQFCFLDAHVHRGLPKNLDRPSPSDEIAVWWQDLSILCIERSQASCIAALESLHKGNVGSSNVCANIF